MIKGNKSMAEQFLTLMGDLNDDSQQRMSEWYGILESNGFTGTQTPGLPYHISLAAFPLEKEREAIDIAKKAAEMFSPVSVHISHVGIFSGGKVLFGGPERNGQLDLLHDACDINIDPQRPWTPHVTLLIDEPERICAAVPLVIKSFRPFVCRIVRLHLCTFWPTREIISAKLTGI